MPDGSSSGTSWYTRHSQHSQGTAPACAWAWSQYLSVHCSTPWWTCVFKLGAEVNRTVDVANYCLIHNVNNGVGSAKLLESSFAHLFITWSCAIHLSLSQHIRWSCPSQWQPCLLSPQRMELPSRIDYTYCCSRPTVYTHPNVKVFLHCGFNPVRRILMDLYITWKPNVNVNYKGHNQTSVSVSSCTIPAWIVLVYAS